MMAEVCPAGVRQLAPIALEATVCNFTFSSQALSSINRPLVKYIGTCFRFQRFGLNCQMLTGPEENLFLN